MDAARSKSLSSLALFLLAALAATGGLHCGAALDESRGSLAFETFHGSKPCANWLGDELSPKESRFAQLYTVMCKERFMGSTGGVGNFDAAVDVVFCVSSGECLDGKDGKRLRDFAPGALDSEVEVRPFHRDTAARLYALTRGLDLGKLEAELAAFDLDAGNKELAAKQSEYRWKPIGEDAANDFRQGFVNRARAAKEELASTVGRFSAEEKRVFLQPALAAVEAWKADETADASLASKSEALKATIDHALVGDVPAPAALVAQVLSLRDDAVNACVARDRTFAYCLEGPLAGALTEEAYHLAVQSGDAALASAERSLLEYAPTRPDLSTSVTLAIGQSIAREGLRAEAYVKAKQQGVGDDALREKFGDAPLSGLEAQDPPRFRQTSLTELQGVTQVRREVSRVDVRGDRAVIGFVEKHSTYDVGVDCHPTNRISYISPSGYVEYEEQCAGTRPVTSTDAVAPIDVPGEEGKLVRPGETIVAVIGTNRRGYVVGAYADEKATRGTERSIRRFSVTPATRSSASVSSR